MDLIITPFSFVLITIGALVIFFSFNILYLIKNNNASITNTMLCTGIWGFFYGLELASVDLEMIKVFIKLQYIGIVLLSPFWLIFSLRYTSYSSPSYTRWIRLSFVIPILSYLAILTNDQHHLFYRSLDLTSTGPLTTVAIERGPLYFVNVCYFYAMFTLGTVIVWKRFKHADVLFQAQSRVIVIAVLIPFVLNIIYQTDIYRPFEVIDLTPFGFLLTYLLIGAAVIKYNLFGIKPIAQSKIIEAITRGVLVVNERFQIVDFNPALKKFIQDPSALKTGIIAHELFQDQPAIIALIEADNQDSTEITITRDGARKIFNVESIYLRESKAVLTGKILMFEDITQQKSLTLKLTNQTQELQKLNDLKDKYFSIISHDLKGPIFGVKEIIHLAQQKEISKEQLEELLPAMSKNMEQVSLLLENLLAWTSSQIRGEHFSATRFQINEVLHSQGALLTRLASRKDIEIVIRTDSNPEVNADKNMIALIIRNLLSNAIKFSKEKSQIVVTSELISDHVKICIIDHGIGISPDYIQHIYDGISFTSAGKHNEGGTGLGLVLVREYVLKNRGTLHITSEEGKGSKFCFTLPLDQPSSVSLQT